MHVGHQTQAIYLRLQRAQPIRQRRRQHGDNALWEIHGCAACPRFVIERSTFTHIVTDIGDGHDQPPTALYRFGIHGIVKVFGVLAIDGDQRQVTQINTLCSLDLINLTAISISLLLHLCSELTWQVKAGNRSFCGQRDRKLRIQTLFNARRANATISRIFEDARDDPITMTCAT